MDSPTKVDNYIEDIVVDYKVLVYAVYKGVVPVYDYEKEEKRKVQVFVLVVVNQVNIKRNVDLDDNKVVENIEQKLSVISFDHDTIDEEIEEEDSFEVVEKS